MRNILILCTTYYQLIIAISLRYSHFLNDNVSLILSDDSQDSEKVSIRVRNMRIFQNFFFWRIKESQNKLFIANKIDDCLKIIFGNEELNEICKVKYDIFIFHHVDVPSMRVFAALKRKNKYIICARFEEGILSYKRCGSNISETKTGTLISYICHLLGKQTLCDMNTIMDFYCCYPELYNGQLHTIQVPQLIQSSFIKQLLCEIFAISQNVYYKEKYIMLTSIFDLEGGKPIGEFELVKEISTKICGIDNLLIKAHPRDKSRVYEKAGFHVDKYSNVPWEIIQTVTDMSDKVLMSIASGSALSVNTIIKNPPKTFFLYNLCNWEQNDLAKSAVHQIKQLYENPQFAKKMSFVRTLNCIFDLNFEC